MTKTFTKIMAGVVIRVSDREATEVEIALVFLMYRHLKAVGEAEFKAALAEFEREFARAQSEYARGEV